ncbi:electron transfer flavoprotein FAD-binding domain protein [Winkia neuii]|uniref:electron transfer flavoprotein subunit alpha/FixB family protein n=1 Tax=Winkia neuii TaxID=33007 RepID=UPI000763DAB8|nr:electron transfer flavoprotein subunit alpha/FixB family protein [Winkia neuii]KWZ74372.1 electron transfer flavoprotein FAD-binding domain protein [Winkia neuii]
MTNALVIATNPQVSALLEAAGKVGDVTVLAVGTPAEAFAEAAKVVSFELAEGTPAEAAAPAVAKIVAGLDASIIFTSDASADRVLAGAVAAALDAPIFRGVKEVSAESVEVARFGGIATETLPTSQKLVLLLDGGKEVSGSGAQAETADGELATAKVISEDTSAGTQVNLPAASKIVACGRGFKNEEDLQLARSLADTIGAEVACSRPLAEGADWFDRDLYVGVSGAKVAPDFYFALGISGQLQHTAGMQDSKTVVAINSDENAPIFKLADYGIVGDLYEVLPALTEALSK